jgi:hypothetical protein
LPAGRAIDGLRKEAGVRARGRAPSDRNEQQPDAWVHNATEEEITFGDTRVLVRRVINTLPPAAAAGDQPRVFSWNESARNRR